LSGSPPSRRGRLLPARLGNTSPVTPSAVMTTRRWGHRGENQRHQHHCLNRDPIVTV
jgi:hypothetical protein